MYEDVYEPGDDTWLLIDSIRHDGRHRLCADLGCGTGVIGIHLLSRDICERTIFIDVNPVASHNTGDNLVLNKLQHRSLVLVSDNYDCIGENVLDLVVANPPYLPGEPMDEYEASLLAGKKGYESIVYFIDFAEKTLKTGGVLYIVYSSLSNTRVIEERLNKCFSIVSKKTKHFFFEDIIVIEAIKKCV